jgi:hypothetical protein
MLPSFLTLKSRFLHERFFADIKEEIKWQEYFSVFPFMINNSGDISDYSISKAMHILQSNDANIKMPRGYVPLVLIYSSQSTSIP